MKWKCLHYLFLPVFFAFFFSFLFLANDTFAAEDINVTIDSSTVDPGNLVICAYNCQTYRFLLVRFNNFNSSDPWSFQSQNLSFSLAWDDGFSTRVGVRGITSFVFFELSSVSSSFPDSSLEVITSSVFYSQTALNTLPSDWSIDIILSENNPFSSGIIPSGSLSITENGTYDVINYAEAVVDVPTFSGGDGGEDCDYHDDLVKIYNAIMTCGGVLLVLYFFYCIYRMIIKSTGGY